MRREPTSAHLQGEKKKTCLLLIPRIFVSIIFMVLFMLCQARSSFPPANVYPADVVAPFSLLPSLK